MKKILTIAAACLALAACSATKSKTVASEDLSATCEPSVLEVRAGKIDATVTMNFPAKYFGSYSTMTVTPVLVYGDQERRADPFILQGDKVKANYIVVSSNGGKVTRNITYKYMDGMEQSSLELRCVAFVGEKRVDLPAIKVADGCNVTYQLAQTSGRYDFIADGYEAVTHLSTDVSLFYDVNSATVQNSSKNRSAINGGREYLNDIQQDSRATVTGTRIIAYASPEGGEKFNAELSDRRAQSAEKAWKQMSKGIDADSLQVVSVGQDWEGFQAAVASSNIEDRDLILRVLSMYSDPAVRESEIRNMSHVYEEISDKVFPSLRRASVVINTDYQNYTEDELVEMAATSLATLDETQILHLAAVAPDDATRRIYLRFAADRFGSQAGIINLAVMDLNSGNNNIAADRLADAKEDTDVLNLKGVIAMREGNYAEAADLFAKSGSADAIQNAGICLILQGKYAEAAEAMQDVKGRNAAVAALLAGDADKAAEAVGDCECPYASYIRAIAAARKGDADGVRTWLEKASVCEELKARAAKDVEFLAFR